MFAQQWPNSSSAGGMADVPLARIAAGLIIPHLNDGTSYLLCLVRGSGGEGPGTTTTTHLTHHYQHVHVNVTLLLMCHLTHHYPHMHMYITLLLIWSGV